MTKKTKFQNMIKANRRILIKKHGFKASTISMWEHGKRIPEFSMAVLLSIHLGVPITDIPYHKIERTV